MKRGRRSVLEEAESETELLVELQKSPRRIRESYVVRDTGVGAAFISLVFYSESDDRLNGFLFDTKALSSVPNQFVLPGQIITVYYDNTETGLGSHFRIIDLKVHPEGDHNWVTYTVLPIQQPELVSPGVITDLVVDSYVKTLGDEIYVEYLPEPVMEGDNG